MSKIAILHFSPPELYPPLQNFIRLLELQPCPYTIYIFTTTGTFTELDTFKTAGSKVKIIRLGKSGPHIATWQRMLGYLLFYAGSFFYLLRLAPKRILYYETISSFPAWLYRRFFNKKVAILIHYHEYTTPAEYANGMMLSRQFHRLEKWLYPLAWVSHTNSFRMQLFEKDILPARVGNPQIIPNYPPASWQKNTGGFTGTPLKIVYVGALGMDTMYTREFASWVIAQLGRVTWDIYSYNLSEEARLYIRSLQPGPVRLKAGLNYTELPGILQQYDVGIILYNGHIPNYVYNAPNKLFEYLSCGLDVWYPAIMKGIHPYNTINTFPKVLPLDFLQLDKFNFEIAVSKEGCTLRDAGFFCEGAFSLLCKTICSL